MKKRMGVGPSGHAFMRGHVLGRMSCRSGDRGTCLRTDSELGKI